MKQKKTTKPTPKPKGNSGISKPLTYGPRVNPAAPAKKSEPKKP